MQTIQFFNSSSSGASLKAVKPVVFQEFLTIAVGAGASFQDLLPVVAAGECAAYGGQIVNSGCYDLKVNVTYLEGGDCDECTVDVLSTVAQEFIVPKNSVFPIPDGFYQQVQVQTVDSAQAAIANTTEVKVSLHSAHSPNCTGCVAAVA
jgi:hypothetical protein